MNLYFKFQTIKTKFKDLVAVLKICPKMINNMPKNRKKCVFWPKNAPLKADFGKNFKIYKNAINASYVRILAQLDDFCPFLGHFCPFWPIFALYGKKGQKWTKMA